MNIQVSPENIDSYLSDFVTRREMLVKKMEMRAPFIKALLSEPFDLAATAQAYGRIMEEEQGLMLLESQHIEKALDELQTLKDRMSSGLVLPTGALPPNAINPVNAGNRIV